MTPTHAAGLNDTGQTTCYNDTQAVTPEPSTHPRQDCTIGRDAAAAAGVLTKVGGGRAGFDYTKIANDGRELPVDAALGSGPADWACTRDNVTGLLWEVKTDDGGLRDKDGNYTWYDDIHADNNGGVPGDLGSDTCGGTLPNSQCNTQAYVAAVNAIGLCGFNDWRLPTIDELHGLVDLEILYPRPTLDGAYFPYTESWYWSSSTNAFDPESAWYVDFNFGSAHTNGKALNGFFYVRLARGGSAGLIHQGHENCAPNIRPTTPTSDFVLDDLNGTATHTKTGLTWMRCSLGQAWDSVTRTCNGDAAKYNWGEALQIAQGYAFAGHNDWRIPNAKELQTIVEKQCVNPAINETIFSQEELLAPWWSSSPEVNLPDSAWFVDFYYGDVSSVSKTFNSSHVRLARGGQSFSDYSGNAVYQTLAISTTGTGAGTITSTPAGIDCGAICSAPFPVGASVTLTATPDADSAFTGWSGACTGADPCTVTMDQDRSVSATFSAALTVTALADPNGTISPASRSVNSGATTTFTVTPNAGYSARVAGCGGTLAGTTYTTGAINAACTVVAEFTPLPTATTPTPTLDALPSAVVNVPYGAVVTAAGGRFPYTFAATGLPAGLALTATGALTGTPTANGDFTPTITVTDAQGQTGARVYPLTVAAATALTLVIPTLPDGVVNAPYHQTLTALGGRFPYTFSATGLPAGLTLSADGLLTGTPAQAGNTAVAITVQDPAGHTATASTVLTVRPVAFTRPDAGQTGETLSVALTTPSGATCTLDDQNTRTFNVGDLGAPATNPPGVTLTDGLLQLVVKGCTAGGVTLNVTLVYPNALPPGAQYWKYGPTFDDATNHWYVLPGAHLAGNIATFTLIDGGLGDADLIANAQITDPGGPAIPLNTIDGAVPAVLPISEPYRVDFQARCNAGACPADSVYHWSLAAGALPDGLTLTGAGATATLSGTPTRVGRYPFTVQVLGRGDQPTTTQQRYTVDIIDPAATRLITHYYVSILEREPEAEGLAYWQGLIAELQGRGQDAKPVFRDMANFFFNSPEYLGRNTTDRQFITNLYLTFFQREPDEDGYAFWLEQLANGMIRNTAMAGFLYSPEFTTFMEEVGF